jgi:flagellar biosynthesis protein FliQ
VTDATVIDIAVRTMLVTAKLASPILLVSLAVGFGISLVQSVTQVQDVTLTFVPKMIGVALVIALAGNWMLAELVGFTRGLFDLVPQLVALG